MNKRPQAERQGRGRGGKERWEGGGRDGEEGKGRIRGKGHEAKSEKPDLASLTNNVSG